MSGRPVIMDESVRFADAEEAAAAVLGFANGVRRAATGHAPTYLGHVFRYEPQGSEAACPFCHPGDRLSLEEAASAAGPAAQSAALPACAPLTVGEVIFGADHLTGLPDFAHGAPLGEARGGEATVHVPEAAAQSLCQNTAKTESVVSIESDAITALRHVNKFFLQLGA